MMKYNLLDIKDYIFKLAEVISEILRVDVEIVDINMIRVAGTGIYDVKIGRVIEGANIVYSKVLESGKKQVIENPGYHKLCMNCPKRNSCTETFEYCTPIIFKEQVIGVISLICFNEKQKKTVIDKFKEYIGLMDRISELIASKASENYYLIRMENMTAELKSIVDYIQDNVVVIDSEDKIVFFNEKFKNYVEHNYKEKVNIGELCVTVSDYGERLNMNNQTQFELNIGIMKKKVMGYINEIDMKGKGKNRIVIFQDMKKLQKTLYEHTQANNVVDFSAIIGISKKFMELKERCKKIASGHASVLITGESGTGKELFARAIHYQSTRNEGPFIAINCGAIPDTLLESELFGYVPGAFTGAGKSGKIGKFELANKGTIFLDEIGDMPLHLQVKLLRVLQDKVVIPIGSNKPIAVNVRVISATNKKLENMVRDGLFREDLYYRLNVIPIEIPPLRERREDIPVLMDYFLNKYCSLYDIVKPSVNEKVMPRLVSYSWNGNVRELENTIEYIVNVLQNSDTIEEKHLPVKIINYNNCSAQYENLNLEEIEKKTIMKAINKYGGNTEDKKKIAKALGISLATLYRKIEKYGIKKIENWELT